MAHEELQFSFELERQNDWQPIYSNQDLGTFYVIYLKINEANLETTAGAQFYSYNMDFRIQNYRGAVTMGFVEQPDVSYVIDDQNHGIDFNFRLSIEPYNNTFYLKDYNVSLSSPIQKGHLIDTNVTVKNVPASLENAQDPNKSIFLDPRLFLRDGDSVDRILTIPENERLKLLDELDTMNQQQLKGRLKKLIEVDPISGEGGGICCPKQTYIT